MLKILLLVFIGFYAVNTQTTESTLKIVDGDLESNEKLSSADPVAELQQDAIDDALQQQDSCSRVNCRPCYSCRDGICLYNPALPGCRTRNNACASITCSQCQTCQVNSRDEPKCIYDHSSGCCPRSEPERRCTDPCQNWQRRRLCPQADLCRPNYCGQCTPVFYDADFFEIITCNGGGSVVDVCAGVNCGTCRICVPDRNTDYRCEEDRQCTDRDALCSRVRCPSRNTCEVQGGVAVCAPDNTGSISTTITNILSSNDTFRWCRAPPEPGHCAMNLNRWYFDRVDAQCKTFTYTGCRPNENNFVRKNDCEGACRGVPACPRSITPRTPQAGCRYIEELGVDFCPTQKLMCNEKPGICPIIQNGNRGLCSNECDEDRDCRGDDKCCSNGCGRECMAPSPTEKSGTCPAASLITRNCNRRCVDDVDCSGIQKCCKNGCGTTCTNPEKATTSTTGTCPNSSDLRRDCSSGCRTDRDCTRDEKCCYNGCGRTCVRVNIPLKVDRPGNCPVATRLSRDCRRQCESDQDCSDRLDKCCDNGCGTTCTRADEPRPRPGTCPVTTTLFRDCRRECEYDLDCSNRNHKCCTNGCGTTCTEPATSRVTRTGSCPSITSLVRNCRRACETDNDCFERDEKCCDNGCGTVCTKPDDPRQSISRGSCPSENSLVRDCRTQCISDDECRSGQKCCSNGCGRSCAQADTGISPVRPISAGVCPASRELTRDCTTQCRRDGDCKGSLTERCCFNGCGYSCAETATALITRNTECPSPGTFGLQRDCRTRCGTDNDCLSDEKCCYNGCSYSCARGVVSKDTPSVSLPIQKSNGKCRSDPCKTCEKCEEEIDSYKCISTCGECEVCSSSGKCLSRELKCSGSFDACSVMTCKAYPQARCQRDRCNCNLATFTLPDGTQLSTAECRLP